MGNFLGLFLLTFVVFVLPADAAGAEGTIDDFLVDVSPGAVSAANIAGADASPVIDVQSTKDLVLAINPFGTNGAKDSYALAFTPARSGIVPLAMAGRTYLNGGVGMRLLGALTLSYAEGKAELSGTEYRKNAIALESSFYLHKEEDPIVIGARAFTQCGEGRRAAERQLLDLFKKKAAAKTQAEAESIQKEIEATQDKVTELSGKNDCMEPARWNAGKVSLSYGQGWIRPASGSSGRLSLGKTFIASAIFGVTDDSAVYVAVRRSKDEVDETTIGTVPEFKSSSLIGVRFTKGESGLGSRDLRLLVEASNAKKAKATSANAAFMYAIGADKKVADGLWLTFRVGRNRTTDAKSTQTTSLLSLNWSPTSTLFQK